MSKHRCRSDAAPPAEDRAAFVRENALALVGDRDALIARLRDVVTRLEAGRAALRAELARTRTICREALAALDAVLDFGTEPEPGQFGVADPQALSEALARARQALAWLEGER